MSAPSKVIEAPESDRDALTKVVIQLASDAAFRSEFAADPNKAIAKGSAPLSASTVEKLISLSGEVKSLGSTAAHVMPAAIIVIIIIR